jgi:hypothetical protein
MVRESGESYKDNRDSSDRWVHEIMESAACQGLSLRAAFSSSIRFISRR